ncbi:glycosyltransferase family protein [Kaistella pullorum]|uniref:Glycosyltransferase RgtA/B/C/D-like domain-containing protein n=1 Tax=Kaistella pullorum TaxID=2763074 RepID=A0ABR8WMI8_9FLAO|nr:hypothetical protein [Kaistella pullorum]MBD8017951.1 hypothetical protein [Kaistella pullorum]
MRRKLLENRIHIGLFAATVVMIVLRILLNEKGRVTPDSIRFMRTSHVIPVIDNTTTPLGYPLSIKFFTLFGWGEFWASKVVGILALIAMIYLAKRAKFYLRETIIVCSLFSFVSIFAATLSEALMLPFVFVFLYVARLQIIGQSSGFQAFIQLSVSLILLYLVRYPAVFFMGGLLLFGLINYRKHYSKNFIGAALTGFLFVALYKVMFIDHFNPEYLGNVIELKISSTSQFMTEFFRGMTTAFNPFIHIAKPGGGIVNFAIFGVGILNIVFAAILFIRNKPSETEWFLVFIGVTGIVCTFLVQFVYVVDALDYRLLAPFTFLIWLVYFKKLYQVFGKLTYLVPAISLLTGLIFIFLSRGNFLENRRAAAKLLDQEKLRDAPLKFYRGEDSNFSATRIAELLSTVNPNIRFTENPKDTLQKTTLTAHKVLRKIKIDTNKFQ